MSRLIKRLVALICGFILLALAYVEWSILALTGNYQ